LPADTVAPTITSRAPFPGATAVNQGQNVLVAFSEAVTGIDDSSFTLTSASGRVSAGVTYDATRQTAALDPSAQLAAGTTYTVALNGPVADIAGNPLAPVSWTFTTAKSAPTKDTITPTVLSRTPNSGATGVNRDGNISVMFSEPVTKVNTTSMTLKTSSGKKTTATVTYDPATKTGTLNPTGRLAAGTSYTAALTKNVVDLAGNRLSAQTWSFTTGN
jgi:hypothetical protein